MRPSDTFVVLDLDGVLLDLQLPTEQVRERIQKDFDEIGIRRGFRPLLATLDQVLTKLGATDPALAESMRVKAWAHIDRAEQESVTRVRRRPGVGRFLERLHGLPLMLYTNNQPAVALAALEAVGIPANTFRTVAGRQGPGALKPSAQPILDALKSLKLSGLRRLFLVGDHPYDMQSVAQLRDLAVKKKARPKLPDQLVAIGLRGDANRDTRLEEAGADFLAGDLAEAADLILTAPLESSLSLVLLAYDEQDLIGPALADSRRFCRIYAPNYELIVVDDGSTDQTRQRVDENNAGDVRIVTHTSNQGMGASMRDGYRAATKDYVAHLPGDRQVRAQSLVRFLPLLRPGRVVLSAYARPPSGNTRKAMSRAFRLLVRNLGQLSVDFAGTYVFSRALFADVDLPASVASQTFLYSFQLLQRFKEAGARFEHVTIYPFPRPVGNSREATGQRMVRMLWEVARHRIKTGSDTSSGRWLRRLMTAFPVGDQCAQRSGLARNR